MGWGRKLYKGPSISPLFLDLISTIIPKVPAVSSNIPQSANMQSYLTLLALALAASTASAHTIFQQIGINGAMQARHDFMRLPHYDGPIEDVTSSALACNGGPNPLLKISNNVAAVQAGDSITLQWGHTLDSDFNSGMIIDASHNGPGKKTQIAFNHTFRACKF